MRIVSAAVSLTLLLATTPAWAAFSKDVTIRSVQFSDDFSTATIMLARDPGEKVHVAYDLYVGESKTSHTGGGTNQRGPIVTLGDFRDGFKSFGGEGTQFRLQFRVCPYDEPYTGKHLYEFCSAEYVTYVTYRTSAPVGPAITNAIVAPGYESITVELSASIEKGYIQYERWGSGNGNDYSSFQRRADGQRIVILSGIRSGFETSGTSGVQSITLRACAEDPLAQDGSTSCGPTYPLTIRYDSSGSFRDVPNTHPNAEAIRFVQQQGIVAGYSDGMFHPDSTINRAEFTKIITLALFGQGMIDKCGTTYSFFDVPHDEWYVKYICRARDGWLLTGYPDGSFRPAQSINFSEAAKILANGYGLIQRNEHCDGKLCPDNDTPEHPWYERYVRSLAEQSAIPLSISRLDQNITRGEMAEMIFRLKTKNRDRGSRSYEQLAYGDNASSVVRYQFLELPLGLRNNVRNIVYSYAVTAPATKAFTMTEASFTLRGTRWSGPQIAINTNSDFTNQIDTWASDDNWTLSDHTTLHGSVTIPPGQTRYIRLSVDIATPADMGFSLNVKHSLLQEIRLTEIR